MLQVQNHEYRAELTNPQMGLRNTGEGGRRADKTMELNTRGKVNKTQVRTRRSTQAEAAAFLCCRQPQSAHTAWERSQQNTSQNSFSFCFCEAATAKAMTMIIILIFRGRRGRLTHRGTSLQCSSSSSLWLSHNPCELLSRLVRGSC